MKDAYSIITTVLLPEKATLLSDKLNQYVFKVSPKANKIEIKTAVEALFSVKVTDVNTLVQRGKVKRMGRTLGKRPNWKKAVVTLREGDDIQFFDESKE